MISIRRDDVPAFLKNGTLYPLLDSEDEESFDLPSNCFKKDTFVTSMSDLEVMLNSARFWGLGQLPVTIISFLVYRNSLERSNYLVSTFPEFGNFLKHVQFIASRPPEEAIAATIKVGFGVKAVMHLHERDHILLHPCAYVAAAERDDVVSMKYLHQRGCPWHEKTVSTAIIRGSLRCLQYAYAYMRDGALPLECMKMAAEAGQIPVMQFLHKIGVPYDKLLYTTAANLAVAKHLRGIGCAWVSHHCSHFVTRNLLDCVIFANSNGSRWSVHTTQAAALNGRLKILQYLHTHGCPWDAQVTYNAAQKGHAMCLKYALLRRCPCTWRTLYCAGKERKWACIVLLIRHRFARLVTALVIAMICFCFAVYWGGPIVLDFVCDAYHIVLLTVRFLRNE